MAGYSVEYLVAGRVDVERQQGDAEHERRGEHAAPGDAQVRSGRLELLLGGRGRLRGRVAAGVRVDTQL